MSMPFAPWPGMRSRSSIRMGAAGGGRRAAAAADAPRPQYGPASAAPPPLETTQVVRRRCTICEWEAQLIERGAGHDPLCPWCYGRTERAEIVGVVLPSGSETRKNMSAATLGRLGGLKGGPARAQKLSAKRRREIASRAARAR